MATTGVGFVKTGSATLIGSTVQPAGTLAAMNGTNADQFNAAGNATRLDKVTQDLATAGYAKNGAVRLTLSGTTAKSIDLTDLTTGAASYAGDTAFASFTTLTLYNDGAALVTVAPASSNPAGIGLSGTAPTLDVGAGCKVVLTFASAVTVDSTHKGITITPTSGGSFCLCVGGA